MTPRELQTEQARLKAVRTGRPKDMKRYLKMQREDCEQANIIMRPIVALDANVTPAHIQKG